MHSDALSIIVHKDFAFERGKILIERLRKLIPRQMFEVAPPAAIGSKVIARENFPAMTKNVLADLKVGETELVVHALRPDAPPTKKLTTAVRLRGKVTDRKSAEPVKRSRFPASRRGLLAID